MMKRLEPILGALILVSATILVMEWIHYRQGDATLWSVVRPIPGFSDVEGGGLLEPVTENEFEQYVAVLERMQTNRDLPIEEALGTGVSLDEFRDIEQRVQRSTALVERARDRLRQTAERLWDSRVATLERG